MTQETKEELASIASLGDEIAEGESKRGGYNAYNTGTINNKVIYSGVKDLAKMTVDQILESSKLSPRDKNRVFAAGKYQIITSEATPTLRNAKKAMPLTGSELFTPELQEKIFLHYLIGEKRPGILAYIEKGKGTSEDAVYECAKEWASIEVPKGRPVFKKVGGYISDGTKSFYESTANHAKRGSGQKVKVKLENARATFDAAKNGGGTTIDDQKSPTPVVDEEDKQTPVTEDKPETKDDGDGNVTVSVGELIPIPPGKLIAQSVGRGGKNHAGDVGTIQTALANHGHSPGAIDHKVGPKTIGAIEGFQATFLKRPDGLVEAGKQTEAHLATGGTTQETKPEKTESTTTPTTTTTETTPTETTSNVEDNGEGDRETQPTPVTQDASLAQLLAQQRLSTEQIAQARTLIAKEPAAKRAELYRLLQTKVLYANQRDNKARENGRLIETDNGNMCNLTSLAMCLSYLGIPNPHPEMQYEDALEKVRQDRRFGARTTTDGWTKVAQALGAKVDMVSWGGTHPRSWWTQKVGGPLAAGRSVMCSITGHIVRIQAVEEDGLVVDDPYSRRKLLPGGKKQWKNLESNTRTADGNAGEDNKWSWDQVEPHSFHWIAAFSK